MRDMVQSVGATGAIAGSMSDEVEGYLKRLGSHPIPGKFYLWPLSVRPTRSREGVS
jgi:hypothetical protein